MCRATSVKQHSPSCLRVHTPRPQWASGLSARPQCPRVSLGPAAPRLSGPCFPVSPRRAAAPRTASQPGSQRGPPAAVSVPWVHTHTAAGHCAAFSPGVEILVGNPPGFEALQGQRLSLHARTLSPPSVLRGSPTGPVNFQEPPSLTGGEVASPDGT